VDHFVIVEGNITFTNKPKDFIFEKAKARFKPFMDKIIHVRVTDMPMSKDAWVNDIFQRNCINRGLTTAEPDDIIMVSDLDEIIRPSTVDAMRADTETNVWALRMPLFNFKFNYMLTTNGCYNVWAMATRNHLMVPADVLRAQRFNLMHLPAAYNGHGIRLMEHAGWQFTYLGDTEFARNKIQSFAHTETNIPEIVDNLDVDRSIECGDGIAPHPDYRFSAVVLDDYFPATVVNNPKLYQDCIVPNATQKVFDFLPQNQL
jgi:beta-1,4-mannosyl-glycoprotein beta-1,4-N-acetylglucosaminyltransferase